MANNTVAIVGTVGVPSNYGGFETLVENLLDGSSDFIVYCSGQAYPMRLKHYKGAKLVYLPLRANGVQSILYDSVSILHAVYKGVDNVLILGVSGAPAIPLVKLLRAHVFVAVNVDGIEWRRAKWGRIAKFVLKCFERIAVKYSDVIISDNRAISEYLKIEYGINSELIAYGGDHATLVGSDDVARGEYALALCRIEPENNVSLILDAFSKSCTKLKFVGNWNASEFGRQLRKKFFGFKHIEMLDPIYDGAALYRIRSECMLYVHGHSAGGTNPSLVEMMHFGVPIVAFDCSYNRETMEGNGVFFGNEAELLCLLKNGGWLHQDVGAILGVAKERYAWVEIRKKYAKLFSRDMV